MIIASTHTTKGQGLVWQADNGIIKTKSTIPPLDQQHTLNTHSHNVLIFISCPSPAATALRPCSFLGVCFDPPIIVMDLCTGGSLFDVLSKAREGRDGMPQKLTWECRINMVSWYSLL